MTNEEKIKFYKDSIKEIDEKSNAIINELEYCIKSKDNSKLIKKGIIEYINDLIKLLINLIYKIY